MEYNDYPDDLREEWERVVAHAWKDPEFMSRLVEDPKTTLEDTDVRKLLNLNKLKHNYLPLPGPPIPPPNPSEEDYRKYINKNAEELFGKMKLCCL